MPSETVDPERLASPRAVRRTAARTLRIGFVQLTDAAPLLVAEELGLFDAVGLRVTLSAEAAWAGLRDKLAFGALDAAQMLGPMPIALAAGLDGVKAQVTVTAGLTSRASFEKLFAKVEGPTPPLASGK